LKQLLCSLHINRHPPEGTSPNRLPMLSKGAKITRSQIPGTICLNLKKIKTFFLIWNQSK
jgi:hypothetical protein